MEMTIMLRPFTCLSRSYPVRTLLTGANPRLLPPLTTNRTCRQSPPPPDQIHAQPVRPAQPMRSPYGQTRRSGRHRHCTRVGPPHAPPRLPKLVPRHVCRRGTAQLLPLADGDRAACACRTVVGPRTRRWARSRATLPALRRSETLVQYSTSMTKRFGHGTCKFGHGTLFYDQLMTKLNWSQKLHHIWSTMTNRSFWS
jgi:hypothetical protein